MYQGTHCVQNKYSVVRHYSIQDFNRRENVQLPRKFVMPDPADRSQNEPAVILSPTQVLGLYNQEVTNDKKTRVVDSVKTTIKNKAIEAGWDVVEPIGNQMLLRKEWNSK